MQNERDSFRGFCCLPCPCNCLSLFLTLSLLGGTPCVRVKYHCKK